jgi:hypothetical protein
MRRWLYVYRVIDGSPDRVAELVRTRLPELLQAATGSPLSPMDRDGRIQIQLPTRGPGVAVDKRVTLRVEPGDWQHGHLQVPVTWHAERARHAYPTFEGTIEVEPHSDHTAQVTVAGSYQIPLGLVGMAIDSTVLSGVAERAAETLVDALARELTARASVAVPVP